MEPEDDAVRVKQEYARRKRRQLFVSIGVLVPTIALLIGARALQEKFGLEEKVAGGIFFAIVLAVLAFSFWNWRCPACRSYLGKAIRQRFCRNCGVQLTD